MKIESGFPTLLLGVSQQAPSVRLEGQMAEQVNLFPDPVLGLSRRPGSIQQAAAAAPDGTVPPMRQHAFSYNNKDYLICAPTQAYGDMTQPFLAYNLTDKQFMTVVYDPADPGVQTLLSSGLAAITSVGKYVFAASNSGRMQADTVTLWNDNGVDLAGKAAVWVRGGAYARTIKLTVTRDDDTVVTVTHTTPSSAYSGTLDTSKVPVFAADPAGGTTTDTEAAYVVPTSPGATTGRHQLNWYEWTPTTLSVNRAGVTLTNVHPAAPTAVDQYAWDSANPRYINFSFHSPTIPLSVTYTHAKVVVNPNYTKLVSDLTNEYNTALTQWIVTAADGIKPSTIANALRDALLAAGLAAYSQEGHVFLDAVKSVIVDDGGDGSLVLSVANTVQDVADLTKKHWVGKVVRVRPLSSNEAFYMKASAANEGETGWTDVVWTEDAKVEYTLRDGLIYATPSATSLYVASSAARLKELLPGDHPDFAASTVGDEDTSPLPYFVDRPISYLGVFQDRLLIGSGAVIRASKVGEYLTFFRSSVLTVPADDPLEMLSQGTDDDVIRYGVLYNRSLVLFGKRQYIINGGVALTPTSAIMPVLSSYAGAEYPIASGGFIFYGKRTETGCGVHQLQPGRNSDEAESFPISAQLSTYITSGLTGVFDVSSPNMLVIRSADPHALFVYKYLDTPEGRLQGAWYKWVYADGCGTLVAAHDTEDGVVLLWHRAGQWVADLQPLNLEAGVYPFLDSMVPYSEDLGGRTHVAFDHSVPHYLFGGEADTAADLIADFGLDGLQAGFLSRAYVIPSPPYQRDRNGKARLSGRLVVTSMAVNTSASSGITVTLVDNEREETMTQEYVPEIEGLADPDVASLTSERIPVSIGVVNDQYVLTIEARSWLPLTITSIDWTGQMFNNVMRM